jgi:hypothetical protein
MDVLHLDKNSYLVTFFLPERRAFDRRKSPGRNGSARKRETNDGNAHRLGLPENEVDQIEIPSLDQD